jgi:hypothetical protein
LTVSYTAGSAGKKCNRLIKKAKPIDASKKPSKKLVMLSSMGADKPRKQVSYKNIYMLKHNADEYLKGNAIQYAT